jgi:hypothetical protein
VPAAVSPQIKRLAGKPAGEVVGHKADGLPTLQVTKMRASTRSTF